MADLSTNIPQISFGQADKETAVNELFDAASPSMLFGRNGVTSAGLGFGLLGGRWNGTVVANKVLTLPDNETLYISTNLSTGSATFQTGSFKTGEMPLYKVTTSGGLVTDYEDHRQMLGGGAAGPMVMADITDKQGKVLDDLIIIAAGDMDTALTAGGYFVEMDDGSSPFEGAVMHVVEAIHPIYGEAVFQSVISPLGGIIATRYGLVSSGYWSDFIYSVTVNDVVSWYNDTTAEAPNAVINDDGSFSRSLFVPAPLAPKITTSLTAEADTDILRPATLTAAATLPNPTGTPIDGFGFVIELQDDGTARALTWGSDYADGFAALPTTSTAGKLGQIAIQYRSGKYRCDGVRWMA